MKVKDTKSDYCTYSEEKKAIEIKLSGLSDRTVFVGNHDIDGKVNVLRLMESESSFGIFQETYEVSTTRFVLKRGIVLTTKKCIVKSVRQTTEKLWAISGQYNVIACLVTDNYFYNAIDNLTKTFIQTIGIDWNGKVLFYKQSDDEILNNVISNTALFELSSGENAIDYIAY